MVERSLDIRLSCQTWLLMFPVKKFETKNLTWAMFFSLYILFECSERFVICELLKKTNQTHAM